VNRQQRNQLCREEYLAVRRVKDSLRLTLQWHQPEVPVNEKLASVAFIIRALQRHLERQLKLEEADGYLDAIRESKPNLLAEAERLRHEHDQFRDRLGELLPSLENLPPADEARLDAICRQISQLLERIELHDQREADLLQEALLRDDGGEG